MEIFKKNEIYLLLFFCFPMQVHLSEIISNTTEREANTLAFIKGFHNFIVDF